jgi:hypothetical protein
MQQIPSSFGQNRGILFFAEDRGLEPHFRVLFSAIFHGVSLGNFHQRGKQWKAVEAKLLQTAASLRTFFV